MTKISPPSDIAVRVRPDAASIIETLHRWRHSEGMDVLVDFLDSEMKRVQRQLTGCDEADFRRLQGEHYAYNRILTAITKGLTKFQE